MDDAHQEKLLRIRHSFSHVMAEAVLQMFPQAGLAIGPAIDEGFYYDFELPQTLATEDLAVIEEKMRAIIAGNARVPAGVRDPRAGPPQVRGPALQA